MWYKIIRKIRRSNLILNKPFRLLNWYNNNNIVNYKSYYVILYTLNKLSNVLLQTQPWEWVISKHHLYKLFIIRTNQT